MRPFQLIALGLICSSLIFSSCNKAEDDQRSTENQIDRATRYIDQGQYDSAINLLEDVLQREDTPRTRMILASAYAGRTGIQVATYWDFLVGFDAFAKNRTPQDFPDLIPANKISSSLDAKGKDLLKRINDQFKELQRLQKKADKIPTVNSAQRKDLAQARIVLNSVTTPGSRLYRALLAAIMIKSDIVRGERLIRSWSEENFHLCKPTATEFANWLWQTLSLASDGLNDAGQAYPEENENYQRIRKDLGVGLIALQSINTHQNITDSLCALQK